MGQCCTTAPADHSAKNTQPLPAEQNRLIQGKGDGIATDNDHKIVENDDVSSGAYVSTEKSINVDHKTFIQHMLDGETLAVSNANLVDKNHNQDVYYQMISTENLRNSIIDLIQSNDPNSAIPLMMIQELLRKWKDNLSTLYSLLLDEYPNTTKYKYHSQEIQFLSDEYEIGETLQRNTFGNIYLAKNRNNNQTFGIKMICKSTLNEYDSKQIQNEMDTMRDLNHRNIVHLYDVFVSSQSIGLVIDILYNEFNLLDVVIRRGILSEHQASIYFIQLVNALQYMHSLHIPLRDIQPDHLIFTDSSCTTLKVVHFGIEYGKNNINKDYMPPDETEYTTQSDMWSAGCILYLLLFGYPPFDALDHDPTLKFYVESEGDAISENAQDLITNLLRDNADERWTAEQVVKHQWIQSPSKELFDGQRMERLRRYRYGRKLRRGIRNMVAVCRLIEIFDEFSMLKVRQNDIIQQLHKLNFEADKFEDRMHNMGDMESEDEIVRFVSDDSDESGANFDQPARLHQTGTAGMIHTIDDDSDSD